jgi:hypothetical protein
MTLEHARLSGADGAGPRVRGAGGGGKAGSSAATAPDTLFSTATVRLVDLLGEGEIVGVRGGLKGVYLNDVPVENADGSSNFKGLSAEFRVGAPDQSYMPGYADVQTPREVGIRVTQATPVVVSITDTDVDRVRVTVQIPSLFLAKADGPVRANTLTYRIEARYSGGPWVNALGDLTLTGKTTSGYFRSHEIPLPRNPAGASAPWQVRVVRLSPDTDAFNASQSKVTSQSDLVFASTTSIVDAKFSYPHSAVVGLTAQASAFGTSVPVRTYLVDGVRMPIPSNYDPATRTYTGIWDGTFGEGFTDNPAWALHLILRDDRFGLGAFIDTAAIDKWALYEIARYCDALVPDGRGGLEPRHTFNGVIATQQEAFELLQLIAQIFRGTVFWSSGTVTASQDRPADPILLVTEANVLDGTFSYASTGRRARHTVALVAWNDPDNLYKPAIEVVEDAEGVARYGYNPTRIDLLGCTSRGQAHRAGRWLLFTELHQTQIVSYRAGLDHAVARPGDLVAIQDPQIANLDLSGRLLAGSSLTQLVLDRPVTLAAGASYAISVTLPDGTVEERAIETEAGTVTRVALTAALTQLPDPAAVWLIAGPVAPQLYRIVSIREEEPHVYAVSALQHEPGKYLAIDRGAAFEPSLTTAFPAVVAPPVDLTVRESQYSERGQAKQALTLSWTAGQPFNAVAHSVTAIRPSGAVVTSRTPSTSIDFTDAETGPWRFLVATTGLNGKASLPSERTYTVVGWAGQAATRVTGLTVKGGGTTFAGRCCTLTWTNLRAETVPPYPIRNVVTVFDASSQALLHREMLPAGQTEWSYDYEVNANEGGPRRQFRVSVCALSAEDGEGPPASLLVSNPPPAMIAPSVQSTSEALLIDLPKVTDPDFAGYLVWVSDTAGIDPVTAKSYEVRDGLFTLKATPGKTYHVRAAAYDAFSNNPAELNVSAEVAKTVTIELFDTSAPARPGQPTLVSSAETGLDGSLSASVRAIWAAVTSANLSHYEVAWQIASGDWETRKVESHAATMRGFRPATAVNAKVRSVSKAGVPSDYGPVGSVTTAKSTLAPANPTNPSVSGRFQRVVVTFTPPAERDLDHIEVWGFDGNSTAASPPSGSTMVGRVPYGQSAYWDDMPTTGQRTYWLRSRNTSDLVATGYLWAGTARTAALDGAQIAAGTVDATRMAAGLEVPRVVTSLPTTRAGQFVTLESDGRLYRWDASQGRYVAETFNVADIRGLTATQIASVHASVLAGQITAAQIRAGAVGADQIAAGAITASKLAIASVNLVPNGDLAQGLFGQSGGADASSGLASWALSIEVGTGPDGLSTVVNTGTGTLAAGKRLLIGSGATNRDGSGTNIPVTGGQRYEISGYLSGTPGANGLVQAVWLQADGRTYINESNGSILTLQDRPAGSLLTRPRSFGFVTAPANAAYAVVRAFLIDGTAAVTNPVIRAAGLMLAPCFATQFEPSSFIAPGMTLIDGGNVFTNSLHADRIAAGTITTDRLQAGAIHVDTIAANGSISAAKLAADVLTAGSITVSGGTKLSAWATGTQINGGAIKADSIDASRLAIGSRAIQIAGLDFECVRDGNGTLTGEVRWSQGWLTWTNDASGTSSVHIPGGTAWPGSRETNFWWEHGAGYLSWAIGGIENAIGPNKVPIAQYWGGNQLRVQRGAGIILDGGRLTALSIDADRIQANAIQARHIAANQITGDKIIGGSIVAGHIAAGQITGAHVAADTIGAGHLAAGSIETRHLRVGVGGKNLIGNSDFSAYPAGYVPALAWAVSQSGIAGSLVINSSGSTWEPPGMKSLQFNFAGTPPAGQIADIYWSRPSTAGPEVRQIPVQGGQRYEFSVYSSAHRCRAHAIIAWYASDGTWLGQADSTVNERVASSGPLVNWFRNGLFINTPANAAYALITLRTIFTGENIPYTFWTGLYFGQASAGQTELSPWGNGAVTTVDGGTIRTGSITADRLSVGSLSAVSANMGTVTAGRAQSPDGKFVIDFTDKYFAIFE